MIYNIFAIDLTSVSDLLKDSNLLGLEWKSPGSSSSLKYCRRRGSNHCLLARKLGTLPLDQLVCSLFIYHGMQKFWHCFDLILEKQNLNSLSFDKVFCTRLRPAPSFSMWCFKSSDKIRWAKYLFELHQKWCHFVSCQP